MPGDTADKAVAKEKVQPVEVMARVLAISSHVVRGHVGLSAIVPVLQRLGHEVWALPTVVLSNHLGHAHWAGERTTPAEMGRMLDTLFQNGWAGEIDAIITGYLPEAEHVRMAARAVAELETDRHPIFLCDPVLGDDPKGLYLDARAAQAIRDDLMPMADIVTPNRFELAWLGGRPARELEDIRAVAGALGVDEVVVTSAARHKHDLLNVRVTESGAAVCRAAWVERAPHGTGDLFAALLLGHLLNGRTHENAFGRAVAGVAVVVGASKGRDELALTSALDAAATAPVLPVDRLE